jgi:glutaredoxin
MSKKHPDFSPSRTRKGLTAWGQAAVFCLATAAAWPAMSQGVYRIVGPDGKVTFSDKPPAADAAPRSPSGAAPVAAASGPALPYELRQVSTRFPVTLYTGAECAPCNSGRNLLNARGIPYTERTVTTANDADALKRLSGDSSLPFLTIGGQQIKGYSDTEWTQFLNAAGYPAQSALPSGYRRPAPTPLVSAQAATPAAPAAATAPSAGNTAQPSPAAEPVVPVSPSNPTGIRF